MGHFIAAQQMTGPYLVGFVIGIVLSVAFALFLVACVFWLVSKITMSDTATFRNAWRLVGCNVLLGIAMYVVTAVAIGPRPVPKTASGLMVLIWIIGVIFSFMIIMYVYEASLWRALAFKLVYYVFVFGMVFLCAVLVNMVLPRETIDKWKRAMAEARQRRESAPSVAAESPSPSPQPGPSPGPNAPPAPAGGMARFVPSPLPPAVTLTDPVQITVSLGGTNSAVVTLPRGTRLKLISKQDDQVTVQYLQSVATIPL